MTIKKEKRKMKNLFKTSKRSIAAILALFILLGSTGFGVQTTAMAAETTEENAIVATEETTQELIPMMAATSCSDLPTNSILLGWTGHGAQSAYSHNGHGVSNAAILQAITTTPIWNDRNQSWNYYGADEVVCLNTSGYVTTCWATTSNGYRY